MNHDQVIDVCYSTSKRIKRIFVVNVMLTIGVVVILAFYKNNWSAIPEDINYFIAFSIGILFLFNIISFLRIFRFAPQISLTPRGMQLAKLNAFIEWHNIKGIRVKNMFLYQVLIVDLVRADYIMSGNTNLFVRVEIWVEYFLFGTPVIIDTSILEYDAKYINELIDEQLLAFGYAKTKGVVNSR